MSPTLKSTWGWVTLGPNLWVFPLDQTRHVGFAKSEHPRLTDGEINFEEFQPMWSQFTNVTDRQTDDMRSQYRALHWSASRGKNHCHRMSPTLKSTGVGHFGPKFGQWVGRYKSNCNPIWERHGTIVCKRNRVHIFCRLSTMHKRTWQIDRQTSRQTTER